jgi:hypothetical protein
MRCRDFIKEATLVAGTAAASFGNASRESIEARLILAPSRTTTTIPSETAAILHKGPLRPKGATRVDQVLLRNEYLAAENPILCAQIKSRLCPSQGEKATQAEIANRRLGSWLGLMSRSNADQVPNGLPRKETGERRNDTEEGLRRSFVIGKEGARIARNTLSKLTRIDT